MDTGSLPNSPIFIVGVHRSGTTLLRYMLSSSPRIYIPPESDFIPRFFKNRPNGRLSKQQISRFLRIIFKEYRFVGEWKGDAPDIEVLLQNMASRTPAAFLNALYRMYAHQHGATRWGDKTPIYTSYVDLIHQIFPTAQFIHIIRDGRDVALSTLDKWGQKELHVDIYYAARIWVRRIQDARAAASRLGPGQYYELRYEHLVENAEKELRAVCDFLDETYLPAMANSHRLARKQIPNDGFHAPVRMPPTTHHVARWKQEMTLADLNLFESVAGNMLTTLGYPRATEAKDLSTRDRLRIAALAAKYEILQTGRSVLQFLGLKPPI
jgi:hypothetical protein